VGYDDGRWHRDCGYLSTHRTCSYTMAIESVLGPMAPAEVACAGGITIAWTVAGPAEARATARVLPAVVSHAGPGAGGRSHGRP
jgi:hypothetical protein